MVSLVVLMGVVLLLLARLATRRLARVTVSPSEPISTLHVTRSSKLTARQRAALDAATATLR